jgi:hypothetical protein
MASFKQLARYRIDSEIEIEATPEQVWKVFGDFGNWDKWNDFMILPVAPERVGKHCQVLFRLDGGCMKESPHEPEVRSSVQLAAGLQQQFFGLAAKNMHKALCTCCAELLLQ